MRNRKGRVRVLLLAALFMLGLTLNTGTLVLAGGSVQSAQSADSGQRFDPDDMGNMPWPQ